MNAKQAEGCGSWIAAAPEPASVPSTSAMYSTAANALRRQASASATVTARRDQTAL